MSEATRPHPPRKASAADETSAVLAALGFDGRAAEPFEPRVVTATVTSATSDVALLRTQQVGDLRAADVVMPVTEWLPSRPWAAGDRLQLLQLDAGPRALVSAVRSDLVVAMFEAVSPEVRAGAVRIMGVARAPGVRAKVAVAATASDGLEPLVDPIAACVGRAANRVQCVSSMLGGEQLDIVSWHPDREKFLCNAMAPAAVLRAVIDDAGHAVVFAAPHMMSAAVGSGGLNSQLAGQLVGVSVTVEPEV